MDLMKFTTVNGAKENNNTDEVCMDKLLVEAARKQYADDLFETVRRCYCEANKDYLQKQIQIASEYLTEDQKEELRKKGIQI